MSIPEASPRRTASILAEAMPTDGVRLAGRLERINEAFKQDGKTGGGSYPIRQAALARQILHLALAIGEQGRRGEPRRLEPRWAELIKRYGEFCTEFGALHFLPQGILDDDLTGLCQYSTRRRGSGKRHFYSAMALFVIDQFETGQMESEFIEYVTPGAEMNFARDMSDFILRVVAASNDADAAETGQDAKHEKHEFPIINVGYTVYPSEFIRFFHHFASPHDGCAHFICYRPGFTHPGEFVKSFLAILPPAKRINTASYGFAHIYKVPSLGDQRRISLGEVLPLEGGLYLVGGQRQMAEINERTLPFKTLKVVALPWHPIEVQEKIFGGLVMSSTYHTRHMVSRLALRATSTWHSDHAKLGAVTLRQLNEDIAGDMSAEAQHYVANDGQSERFGVDPEAATKRIIDLCNNDPVNWEAPHGFFALDQEGTIDRHRPLNKLTIESKLLESFGSDDSPAFKSSSGAEDIFAFWRNLHFGPLTAK